MRGRLRRLLRAPRALAGWTLAVLGAVALFLGWYGVSGTALTAKQLPYLVSGGLTGVALLVLASALLAGDDVRRQVDRLELLEDRVETLYRLLVQEGPVVPAQAAPSDELVALPSARTYHRGDCGLVRGKPARAVDAHQVAERGLAPCRVCSPVPLAVS